MYTNDSEVSGNVSVGNNVGYAIMFSDRLEVTDNFSDGDRDHGLLLNYANGSEISGNLVQGRLQPLERWTAAARIGGRMGFRPKPSFVGNGPDGTRLGPEKCVFIYNANRNRFTGNGFEGCAIGIHFTAGSEGNAMAGNASIATGTRSSTSGPGTSTGPSKAAATTGATTRHSTSTATGSRTTLRPNDLVDRVLWTAPQAKVLINSPAVR